MYSRPSGSTSDEVALNVRGIPNLTVLLRQY